VIKIVVGDIETSTDLLVIGAGPGGYTAAIRGAQKGLDVVLVDKEKLGGTCLNRGCIPAKALIHASKFHKEIQDWHEIGIEAECENIDFSKIMSWKDSVVEELNSGLKHIIEREGIEVMKGEARFIDEETVRVSEEHNAENVNFDKAIIATGSRPVEIQGIEFDNDKIISSRKLLNLDEVPEELVVVGGGYIGMEAATKFSKFGTDVKIVEAEERILQNFDEDIVDEIKESGPEYSDEIYTSAKASGFRYENDKILLEAETEEDEIEIRGDYILVAVGRTPRPVLDNLDLNNTDVEVKDGFIEVDDKLRTSQENIFAIGDCIGQPMLAHKAYREGRVAAEVASGEASAFDNQYIPKAMYTDPEVATVGMSLDEARKEFDDVLVGEFPFRASGRSLTINQESGFVRVVASGDEKLQGVQIVGSRASDMIAEATLALEMQVYLDDIINTIHAHPTFPEAFAEACEDARDEAIHI